MEFINILVLILLIIIFLIYLHIKRCQSFWTNVQKKYPTIPYLRPTIFIGNIQVNSRREQFSCQLRILYEQLKGKGLFGGVYIFLKPAILALDLDFIKTILIKDFDYFHDRGLYYNEKIDPLSAHLFSLNGIKWRNLRAKLTPTFTSGKMKFMFSTMVKIADNFQQTLLHEIQLNQECIEIKDLLERYTIEVIGTCAFGIKCNSLKNDKFNVFHAMGKRVLKNSRNVGLILFILSEFQKLSNFFQIKITDTKTSKFFQKVIRDTIEYREKYNIKQNDFINILIQLKNNNNNNNNNNNGNKQQQQQQQQKEINGKSLTIEEISAQAYLFFLAGFETSATTMAFCLYELAVNQNIQKRARNEIKNVLQKYNDNLNYEAIVEMIYLDQIINETLRKYPPLGFLFRRATKNYNVSRLNYTIRKDTLLLISVYGIHHNTEYYPEPGRFDPERFTIEKQRDRNPMTFIPFGDGPRNCIGLRFGLLQTKIGIIKLLTKFQFNVTKNTPIPIKISRTNFLMTPETGLYLNVKEI